MSNKEVQESKFRFTTAKPPKEKKGKTTFLDGINISEKKKNPIEFHFNKSGNLMENSEYSFAMKKEHPNGVVDYFVKVATAGAGVGKMLNPWGVYYNTDDEFKYEKTMGRKRYEFRKVSSTAFENYLQFLKTRSERYILSAERELNNG